MKTTKKILSTIVVYLFSYLVGIGVFTIVQSIFDYIDTKKEMKKWQDDEKKIINAYKNFQKLNSEKESNG